MIKILITDKLAQEGIDLLNSKDDVEAVVKTGISEDELADIIGDYDGLIIRSGTKVTEKVLEKPGKLKAIARAGVGVDNIDIPAATKKGVIVMNTPGGNTQSAAEHAVALMMSLSRNIAPACSSLKGGAWDRKKFKGSQLSGKVLGLIGLGRIGMSVARMAKGIGMRVIGYDPFATPPEAEKAGVEITDDLEKIYKESDYISVHVPKNDETNGMIGKKQIAMMKPTVRLINCARGGIINEDAAYDALKENKIAGVAFDVYPSEPPENKRFSEFESALVTPHLGASTVEAQIGVAVEAAEIIVDAIKGGPVRNALNAPSTSGAVPTIVEKYCELSKRVGKLLSTITTGKMKSIKVEYRGSIAEMDIKPVNLNFVIGLLQKHCEVPLNMVNAEYFAKERGLSIDSTLNSQAKDVNSSFCAEVTTDKVCRTVVGSVFGGTQLRIINIDGFDVEMTPEGAALVIFNDDKPGVIGSVGTVCGKHGINICTMGVGQKPNENKAVLAVSLDKEPDDKAIAELKKLDFVNEIYVCKLD
jgi:D-3-phosphoglycerate dehydrogenase